METIRRLIAVVLGLVALTALISPEEIAYLFLGLSPDSQIHAYSWLQLEIALGGLLGPAVILFNWPRIRTYLNSLAGWLGAIDNRSFWIGLITVGAVARLIVLMLFDPVLSSDAAEYPPPHHPDRPRPPAT